MLLELISFKRRRGQESPTLPVSNRQMQRLGMKTLYTKSVDASQDYAQSRDGRFNTHRRKELRKFQTESILWIDRDMRSTYADPARPGVSE